MPEAPVGGGGTAAPPRPVRASGRDEAAGDAVAIDRHLAVNNALLMISHAAERGLDLKEPDVQAILDYAGRLDADGRPIIGQAPPDAAVEGRFWAALARLSALIRPASAAAIRERTEFLLDKRRSASSGTIRLYKWWIWVILVLTLFMHAYYVILDSTVRDGADALQRFEAARADVARLRDGTEEAETPQFRAGIGEARSRMCQAANDWHVAIELIARATPLRSDALDARLKGGGEGWEDEFVGGNDYCQLGNHMDPHRVVATLMREAEVLTAQQLARWETAKVAEVGAVYRNVVGQFLLPLLYGTLGGIASVVRALSASIREIRFSRAFRLEYGMQIPLGALTGATIGLVLSPESLGTVAGLTSLGLAFAVGYSVDVVFAFLDGLVGRLTQRGAGTVG